jgi:hypothetical protein
LESQILVPYFEGRAIVDDGVITKVGDIAQIQVIRTEQPSGKLPRRTLTAEGVVYVGNDTWRNVVDNGTDVTNEFITGAPHRPTVGAIEQERLPRPAQIGPPYVDARVVKAIRACEGRGQFDVTKLLALVNELNDNYASMHTYASHALLRAVLDHVPPAFGYANFREVANNYPWKPTDKRYMKKLAEFRDQADDALHRQISAKADLLSFEDMPSSVCVDRLLHECAERL